MANSLDRLMIQYTRHTGNIPATRLYTGIVLDTPGPMATKDTCG